MRQLQLFGGSEPRAEVGTSGAPKSSAGDKVWPVSRETTKVARARQRCSCESRRLTYRRLRMAKLALSRSRPRGRRPFRGMLMSLTAVRRQFLLRSAAF